MKRLTAIFLILLVLCGCGAPAADPAQTAPSTQPSQPLPPVDPTEPGGSYDPDSSIELRTGGAVKAYPLSIADVYAMAVMGNEVVVFSGTGSTSITKLSGDNLYVTAAAQSPCRLDPRDGTVRVTDDGIVYYDSQARQIVVLDSALKKVIQLDMPQELAGRPVLTSDRKTVYYCTADALRVLDTDTGISRMLREMAYPGQSVTNVLCQDTVVQLQLGEDPDGEYLFLSADTGRTLGQCPTSVHLTGNGEYWYVAGMDGIAHTYLYGSNQQEAQALLPVSYTTPGAWLPEADSLVTFTPTQSPAGMQLDVYRASSGKRTAALFVDCSTEPICLDTDTATGEIYFLAEDLQGQLTLYRWDPAATPIEDDTVYSAPRYTMDNPDTQGLAECQALAQQLEQRHSVDIRFGREAVTGDQLLYTMTAEYQVPVLRDMLTQLDTLLAAYPQGMLGTAMTGISQEPIRILLVRQLCGSPESGNTDAVSGGQFWIGSENYVVLAAGCDLPATLYRQMYYALENCLMSNSNDLYDWEYLNPSGFDYDYDYTTYLSRYSSKYVEGDTRYFIDIFSMTFPREDRAAIMQYAMLPGNEEYFANKHMQAKLRALGKAIREACGLEESTETFLWEQYLERPLAYKPK